MGSMAEGFPRAGEKAGEEASRKLTLFIPSRHPSRAQRTHAGRGAGAVLRSCALHRQRYLWSFNLRGKIPRLGWEKQ